MENWENWLLILTWPSPDCWAHVGDGRPLSVSPTLCDSAIHISKINLSFKKVSGKWKLKDVYFGIEEFKLMYFFFSSYVWKSSHLSEFQDLHTYKHTSHLKKITIYLKDRGFPCSSSFPRCCQQPGLGQKLQVAHVGSRAQVLEPSSAVSWAC